MRVVVVVGEGEDGEERGMKVVRDIKNLSWSISNKRRPTRDDVHVNYGNPRQHDAQPPLVGFRVGKISTTL
jgi:hypothetical protein